MSIHTQPLIDAFAAIGVKVTPEEVPVIKAIGADKFLATRVPPHNPGEESMASIYIILSEMAPFDNEHSQTALTSRHEKVG